MGQPNFLLQVDEGVERALRQRGLDGKHDLMTDMLRGHHARTVIAEMNHAKALKDAGEQLFDSSADIEFRLEGIVHGQGFHQIAMNEGTYEVWNTDQSDRLDWIKKKFPENKIKERSTRCMITVGSKYGPPEL